MRTFDILGAYVSSASVTASATGRRARMPHETSPQPLTNSTGTFYWNGYNYGDVEDCNRAMNQIRISDDELLTAAGIVVAEGRVSTVLLQQMMGVGFARAVALIDELEKVGVVTPVKIIERREVIPSRRDNLVDFINIAKG